MNQQNIPEINLTLETKEVKTGIVYIPYILINPPYILLHDKDGSRKVWIANKTKIILYYLYKFTKIKWFIKQYNK